MTSARGGLEQARSNCSLEMCPVSLQRLVAAATAATAARAERQPSEAVLPLDELRNADIAKLVLSGAHNAALDAVCDVLVDKLDAQRTVITGAGHTVNRTGAPFNERLQAFVEASERRRRCVD